MLPYEKRFHFQTQATVSRTGLMIVGWGGNNGSTLTASMLANKKKMQWTTKEGRMESNYYGSVTQASTLRLGTDSNGMDIFVPFYEMLPMVDPNDIIIGGWDISSMKLGDAMERAKVLDWDLQKQLKAEMNEMKPLPSIYYPDFIAANQEERANNIMKGSKQENLEQIRADIRYFRVLLQEL